MLSAFVRELEKLAAGLPLASSNSALPTTIRNIKAVTHSEAHSEPTSVMPGTAVVSETRPPPPVIA